MTPTKSKQVVLVSMLALMAISVYRQKGDPGTLYKRVWGTGVLGVMLSLMADFIPDVAGPFAGLVVLGALTNGGDKAINNLLGGVTGAGAGVGATVSKPKRP